MSDSNKDLYGGREILTNYIGVKRNFIPASIGMLLWQDKATLCEVLRFLLISSRLLGKLPQRHTTVILISPYKHCISATNIEAIVREEKSAAEDLRASRYKLGPIIFHFKPFLRQNVASKKFLKKLKILRNL